MDTYFEDGVIFNIIDNIDGDMENIPKFYDVPT